MSKELREIIKGDQALIEVAGVLDRELLPEMTDEILRWVLAIPDYIIWWGPRREHGRTRIERNNTDKMDIEIFRGAYSFEEWHCWSCRGVYRINVWNTKEYRRGLKYYKYNDCCKKKEERAFYYKDSVKYNNCEVLRAFWTNELEND